MWGHKMMTKIFELLRQESKWIQHRHFWAAREGPGWRSRPEGRAWSTGEVGIRGAFSKAERTHGCRESREVIKCRLQRVRTARTEQITCEVQGDPSRLEDRELPRQGHGQKQRRTTQAEKTERYLAWAEGTESSRVAGQHLGSCGSW